MFGFVGFVAMAEMFLTAAIMHGISDGEMAVQYSLPSVILVMYVFLNISSCEMFNASEYASLAGSIESQGMAEWAKENKIIDENNIRLVPESLRYSAHK